MRNPIIIPVIYTILILIVPCNVIKAQKASQTLTIAQDNPTIEELIRLIEQQTEHSFVYQSTQIQTQKTLQLKSGTYSLRSLLEKMFPAGSFNYKIDKKKILIKKKGKSITKQKHTISGIVADSETGEPLIGVSILIREQGVGTVTNNYGFYSISLPKENYTVLYSYLGYSPITKSVKLDKNHKINVEIKLQSFKLEETVVTSTANPKSHVTGLQMGVNQLSANEIKSLPALLGEPDITRAILTQSGVSSIGEGTSGFNVRGGNIDQNLILLDEAPIYNSSHVFGFFSVFNSGSVKNVKLHKGAIPARFGGRGSSVLEIHQKEGSFKKITGEGGIGVLFSRLQLEAPIVKDKLSFIVSGRRSYFDLFFPLSNDESLKNNKLYFYDLSGKITWKISEKDKLYFSGYFGADVMNLEFDYSDESTTETPNIDKINFHWGNATSTIRWNHLFNDKLFSNTTAIFSRYNYGLASRSNVGGPVNTFADFDWKSSIDNWSLKSDFTYYKDATTKLQMGISGIYYVFNPATVKAQSLGTNNLEFDEETALELAAYTEFEKSIGNFSFNAGLRYSFFGPLGGITINTYAENLPRNPQNITGTKKPASGKFIKKFHKLEPRISLKYELNGRKAFKAGYNRMFQYIHLISNTNAAIPFDIWKPTGYHIKPLEVNQFSLGYAYDTQDRKYNFSAEAFYKKFKDFLEYKDGAELFLNAELESELLDADGRAYGFEISANKSTGKLTGFLNYTYSKSERKTKSSFPNENINNGNFYPSNYDRPHALNLSLNYPLGKKFKFGAFFTYQSGRPVTYPTGQFKVDNNVFFTYSDRNKFRIPDTHRLDISFTYTPKAGRKDKKWKGSWSFGAYNIYSRKNAFSIYSITENSLDNPVVKTYQFSMIGSAIPFISYNFKF